MLDVLEVEPVVTMPAPWPTLYLITERRTSAARLDDPEVRGPSPRGQVFDLRNPKGDVVKTSSDLSYLRELQARYNSLALQG